MYQLIRQKHVPIHLVHLRSFQGMIQLQVGLDHFKELHYSLSKELVDFVASNSAANSQ